MKSESRSPNLPLSILGSSLVYPKALQSLASLSALTPFRDELTEVEGNCLR